MVNAALIANERRKRWKGGKEWWSRLLKQQQKRWQKIKVQLLHPLVPKLSPPILQQRQNPRVTLTSCGDVCDFSRLGVTLFSLVRKIQYGVKYSSEKKLGSTVEKSKVARASCSGERVVGLMHKSCILSVAIIVSRLETMATELLSAYPGTGCSDCGCYFNWTTETKNVNPVLRSHLNWFLCNASSSFYWTEIETKWHRLLSADSAASWTHLSAVMWWTYVCGQCWCWLCC